MYIRVLASQIPAVWESVKVAAVTSQGIKEEHQGDFLNGLLHSLLSDLSQCFVKLDDDRRVVSVALTQIQYDKVTKDKCILIQAFHSWGPVTGLDPRKEMEFVVEFARTEGAKYITVETGNHMSIQAALAVGFVEVKRRLDFNV